jgi:hypothetical protein
MATNTIGSGGDYSTLALWEAARQTSTDATERAELLDGTHTGGATFAGWTTSSTVIEIVGQNNHGGDFTPSSGATWTNTIQWQVDNPLVVEDLIVDRTSNNGGNTPFNCASAVDVDWTFRRCIFFNPPSSFYGTRAVSVDGGRNAFAPDIELRFESCIFEDWTTNRSNEQSAISCTDWSSSHTDDTYNITLLGCTFRNSGVMAFGEAATVNLTARGCLIEQPGAQPFFEDGSASGTYTVSLLYCLTDESSIAYAGTTTGTSSSVTFNDTGTPSSAGVWYTDAANDDYSLQDDANNEAIDFVTTGTMPSDDIAGTTRDSTPDAGAFEVVSSGVSATGGTEASGETGATATAGHPATGGTEASGQTGGTGSVSANLTASGGTELGAQTGGTSSFVRTATGGTEASGETGGTASLSGNLTATGGTEVGAETGSSASVGHPGTAGSQIAAEVAGTAAVSGNVSSSGGTEIGAQTGAQAALGHPASGGSEVGAQTGGVASLTAGNTGAGGTELGAQTGGTATLGHTATAGSQAGLQTGALGGTSALLSSGASYAAAQTGGVAVMTASVSTVISQGSVSETSDPSPAAAQVSEIVSGFAGGTEIRPDQRRVVPLRDSALDPRVLDDNFRTVQEELDVPEGVDGPWVALAKRVGGSVYRVDLSTGEDTILPHSLGRIPTSIFYSRATDGFPGEAVGNANGGSIQLATMTLNERPWTTTDVAIRGTRAANYIVVIV